MTLYVVATRQELRGQVKTAADAVTDLEGVSIRGNRDPNRIVIESSDTIETMRNKLGDTYLVEENFQFDIERN